ncbi:MAG: hypothetical protein IPO19_16940 [Rhodoferax sp.]|jgi:hypothetical protein|nr:hypothetical protein [Rhodoferax sp.]MBK9237575.1 hypothetical protein [Rhodoferax sp.]
MEISPVKALQSPQLAREPTKEAQRPPQPQTTPDDAPRRPPVVNTQGQTTGRIVNTTA